MATPPIVANRIIGKICFKNVGRRVDIEKDNESPLRSLSRIPDSPIVATDEPGLIAVGRCRLGVDSIRRSRIIGPRRRVPTCFASFDNRQWTALARIGTVATSRLGVFLEARQVIS